VALDRFGGSGACLLNAAANTEPEGVSNPILEGEFKGDTEAEEPLLGGGGGIARVIRLGGMGG
jgi:hypothetical protein